MKGLNDSKTDELLTLLEEQQEENETLQAQILEARQTVSLLSSQNSILRNELRKKSETIVSLNEQIGKLSESDLVLKRNEILKRQIIESRESVQSVRREAEIAVSTAEKKAEVYDKFAIGARNMLSDIDSSGHIGTGTDSAMLKTAVENFGQPIGNAANLLEMI